MTGKGKANNNKARQAVQAGQPAISAAERRQRKQQSKNDKAMAAMVAAMKLAPPPPRSSATSRRRGRPGARSSKNSRSGPGRGPWKLEHHGLTRVDKVVERFEITMLGPPTGTTTGSQLSLVNSPVPPEAFAGTGSLRGMDLLGVYSPGYQRHTLSLFNLERPETGSLALNGYEHHEEDLAKGLHAVNQDPPIVVQNADAFARCFDAHLVLEITLGASSRGTLMLVRSSGEIGAMSPRDAHAALVRDRHMVERFPLKPGQVNRIHVRPGVRQSFAYGRFKRPPGSDPKTEAIIENDSRVFHQVVFGLASYAVGGLDAPALIVAHAVTYIETELPLSLNHLADNLPRVGHATGASLAGANQQNAGTRAAGGDVGQQALVDAQHAKPTGLTR